MAAASTATNKALTPLASALGAAPSVAISTLNASGATTTVKTISVVQQWLTKNGFKQSSYTVVDSANMKPLNAQVWETPIVSSRENGMVDAELVFNSRLKTLPPSSKSKIVNTGVYNERLFYPHGPHHEGFSAWYGYIWIDPSLF